MLAIFRREMPMFVKVTSVALSICLGLTGAIGLKGLSLGDLQVCYGDFITICRPAEVPALVLFLFVAGTMTAFFAFVRIRKHSPKLKQAVQAIGDEYSSENHL
jgi:hypothetical protein